MRWKTTAALLAAVLGVGAYVSLVELRHPTVDQQARLAKQLLDLDQAKVREVVLDLPHAKLTLTRDGEAWRIGDDRVRADAALVGQLLAHFSPLMVERTMGGAGAPLDPATYGLAPPAGSIRISTDTAAYTLLFGSLTPLGDQRYVKQPDQPAIHLVPPSLFEDADRPADALRDHQLIQVNPWEVEALMVKSGAGDMALARTASGWRLRAPLDDAADHAAVSRALNGLAGLRIQRFVNDRPQPEGVPAWEFNRPLAELTLDLGGVAPRRVTVFFGAGLEDDGSLVYAKRDDEPPVYAVSRESVQALLIDPHTLRATAPFSFFPAQAAKVSVIRGGSAWTIVRRDEGWQEDGSGRAVDAAAADRLLRELTELRISGFLDEAPAALAGYGLEPPWGSVAVWLSGTDEPQKLLIGGVIAGGENRYGKIEGRAAIVRLPPDAAGLAPSTLEELVNRSAAR